MMEALYDINSGLVAVALFVTMIAAMEGGYRLGRRRQSVASAELREHINGIQASMLGILALLLGFTFSLALQRFDSRSEAVVDEANAIGTAYLRIQLLPTQMRPDAVRQMSDYVDLRVESGLRSSAALGDRARDAARAQTLQSGLWDGARRGIEFDPNIYAPALYVEAVNGMIDSYGRRDASLNRHVPEVVLLLLYATFIAAGLVVGFAAGIAGHRPSRASHVMVLLIVVLVFIIIDLDRPRRGLIQVSQQSMLDLQGQIHGDQERQKSIPAAHTTR